MKKIILFAITFVLSFSIAKAEFEVFDIKMSPTFYTEGTKIKGKVKNTYSKTCESIFINLYGYDNKNYKVGEDVIYINELTPNEIYVFESFIPSYINEIKVKTNACKQY